MSQILHFGWLNARTFRLVVSGWFGGLQRQNNDQFEITKYVGPHTCVSTVLSQDNSSLDSNLIANEILNLVNKNPKVNIQAIGAFVKTVFNCTTSYRKL